MQGHKRHLPLPWWCQTGGRQGGRVRLGVAVGCGCNGLGTRVGVATTPRAVTHKHRHTPPEWPNPSTSGASASLLAGAGRFLVGKDRPPNDIRQAHCRCTVLSSPCRFTLQMQGTRQDERTQNSATEECDRSNRLLVRITGSTPQSNIRITVVLCFVCSFPLEIKRSFDTQQFSICNTEHVQQICNVLLQPLS